MLAVIAVQFESTKHWCTSVEWFDSQHMSVSLDGITGHKIHAHNTWDILIIPSISPYRLLSHAKKMHHSRNGY